MVTQRHRLSSRLGALLRWPAIIGAWIAIVAAWTHVFAQTPPASLLSAYTWVLAIPLTIGFIVGTFSPACHRAAFAKQTEYQARWDRDGLASIFGTREELRDPLHLSRLILWLSFVLIMWTPLHEATLMSAVAFGLTVLVEMLRLPDPKGDQATA